MSDQDQNQNHTQNQNQNQDQDQNQNRQKSYHTKATGLAAETVQKRSNDEDLKLFGSCFWYAYPCIISHLHLVRAMELTFIV